MAEKNVAVEVAKEIVANAKVDEVVILSTGVRVRFTPVSTGLIEEVTARVKDPEVPTWHNEAKNRDEPNPDDPRYITAVEEANRKRGLAVMDALSLFGVELVDGLPDDDRWLKNLRFMEKRGQIDLSGYDLSDPFDLEFLFKRYVALDNETLSYISKISTMTEEAVAKQEERFPRNKTRRAN